MGGLGQERGPRRRIDDARRLRDVLRFEFAGTAGLPRILPDERELSRRLACSRNTLRDALNLLRGDQLIERRPGVGTFVRREPLPLVSSRSRGLLYDVESGPERVRYRIVEVLQVPASGRIGATLGAPLDATLWVLTRLTTVDDVPVVLWDTYVREEVGTALAAESGDMYDLFEGVGITVADVSLRVEAVLADASMARLLRVTAGQPLLRFERALFDASGTCVALSFGRARGDRVQFSVGELHSLDATPSRTPLTPARHARVPKYVDADASGRGCAS